MRWLYVFFSVCFHEDLSPLCIYARRSFTVSPVDATLIRTGLLCGKSEQQLAPAEAPLIKGSDLARREGIRAMVSS